MTKYRVYSITIGILVTLFVVFVFLWFFCYNRFSVLYYHEQMQLFRFDQLYFYSYINQPGGLTAYLGSFLTQFYYYPLMGAIIIACIPVIAFLLFYSSCKYSGYIERIFLIPFIPAVLLMLAFTNIHFDMAYALGLIFALTGFRIYVTVRSPVRYWVGAILTAIIYLVTGGNALLLTVLIVIFELFGKENKIAETSSLSGKEAKFTKKQRLIFPLLLIIWIIVLPWLAHKLIYITPLRKAYLALTPGNILFPDFINISLWLSFPVLYLIWRFIANKVGKWEVAPWKLFSFNTLLVIGLVIYDVYTVGNRRAEILNRMEYEVQKNNWDTVIKLGKIYPTKNRLAIYFTNIALAESGQLPHRMFYYKQVGVPGLFLDWQLTYHSLWHLGEIYYRLGMIPEAEHCAFEAMVATPKEPNAQTLRRLVLTNIMRRDSVAACKYMEPFGRSLAYRKWAQQQRKNLTSAMSDSSFLIQDTPQPYRYDDFFINYQHPDHTLLMLLQTNPRHQLAFEYLMAYYMLQKNIESTKWCLDTYYKNFDYGKMPVHYEEMLMAYYNSSGDKDSAKQHSISNATIERLEQYAQAYRIAKDSRRNLEQLEKKFGNTYWYYIHFVEPATLQKKDEKNRY